jgi:KDO2-lipid IV(A) lauroyltransferase
VGPAAASVTPRASGVASALHVATAECPRALGGAPGPLWARAIAAIVALLPHRALAPIGRALGFLVGRVLRIRRAEAKERIAASDVGDPDRVVDGMYASLGVALAELVWLAGRPPSAVDPLARVTERSEEAIASALAEGRGLVLATAHTGNWDLGACAFARFLVARGRRLHVVTKRLHARGLDRFWQRLRAERGVVLVDAAGAWRPAREALRRGDVVVILVDQAPERASGVAVFPFFGRPARHDGVAALLAARSRAPLAVAFPRRAGELHVLEVVDVVDQVARDDASLLAITERIARALERFVRAHPTQWLWLHRRWKGAPRA